MDRGAARKGKPERTEDGDPSGLSRSTEAFVHSLVDGACPRVNVPLSVETVTLDRGFESGKRSTRELIWIFGGVMGALIVPGGFVIRETWPYHRSLGVVTHQIEKMSDKEVVQELKQSIKARSEKSRTERTFQRVLRSQGS